MSEVRAGEVWRHRAHGTDFRVCWVKDEEVLGEIRWSGVTQPAPWAGRETPQTLARDYELVYGTSER